MAIERRSRKTTAHTGSKRQAKRACSREVRETDAANISAATAAPKRPAPGSRMRHQNTTKLQYHHPRMHPYVDRTSKCEARLGVTSPKDMTKCTKKCYIRKKVKHVKKTSRFEQFQTSPACSSAAFSSRPGPRTFPCHEPAEPFRQACLAFLSTLPRIDSYSHQSGSTCSDTVAKGWRVHEPKQLASLQKHATIKDLIIANF